ncbi:MAG: hypothetical protein NTAFB09_11420 [Nitrosospira sp.]
MQDSHSIFGELDIFAVPEPATWLLILVGMATGIFLRSLEADFSERMVSPHLTHRGISERMVSPHLTHRGTG